LRPPHPPGIVAMLADRAGFDRLIEARPARARFIFRRRVEQGFAAAYAKIGARTLFMQMRPRPRRLGAMLTRDAVLFRRQLLAPLRVALLDPCHSYHSGLPRSAP